MEFMEELILMLYRGLDWNNLHEVISRMKAVKNERKEIEKTAKKMANKLALAKKEEEEIQLDIKDKSGLPDAF